VGSPLSVLAERHGTGHAENFAPVVLTAGCAAGEIVTITPQRVIDGVLA
jgi:threonylcarbamoyladenosine tRNA methylthiotransferase MtaB